MTRDEIEEGRRLHTTFIEELKRFARGENAFEIAQKGDEWEAWFNEHSEELLSLAEEARWRNMSTEPPDETHHMVQAFEPGIRGVKVNDWSREIAIQHHGLKGTPTHWRPLPKGPAR